MWYPSRDFETTSKIMLWLHKLLLAIVTVPVKWLVKVNSTPSDLEAELGIDKSRPIVYLLRTRSVTDQLALKMSTLALGLPKPTLNFTIDDQRHSSCLFLQKPKSVLNRKTKGTSIQEDAAKLFSNRLVGRGVMKRLVVLAVPCCRTHTFLQPPG